MWVIDFYELPLTDGIDLKITAENAFKPHSLPMLYAAPLFAHRSAQLGLFFVVGSEYKERFANKPSKMWSNPVSRGFLRKFF
jgi:hypothetical protein